MGFAPIPTPFCDLFFDMLNVITDNPSSFKDNQYNIALAGCYRDPKFLDKYLTESRFLPYLNNEKERDQSRYDKFISLN